MEEAVVALTKWCGKVQTWRIQCYTVIHILKQYLSDIFGHENTLVKRQNRSFNTPAGWKAEERNWKCPSVLSYLL